MKKLLMVLGGFFAAIILIVGIILLISFTKVRKHNKTAIPYIEKTLPILSQWDARNFKTYMLPQAIQNVSDEDFGKTIKFLSKVGKLESFEMPIFQNMHTSTHLPTIITYQFKAQYTNGEATVSIALAEVEPSYQIYQFHIHSTALME